METRIVIPALDGSISNTPLSGHFGRAPFFTLVIVDEEGTVLNREIIPNRSEHFGGTGSPVDRILQLEANAVITHGMGPRALGYFQNAQVAVLRTTANTVEDAVAAYISGELEELTEGCQEARHK
jgi:predicted Fe-Mo cluster-binding NifX family protein